MLIKIGPVAVLNMTGFYGIGMCTGGTYLGNCYLSISYKNLDGVREEYKSGEASAGEIKAIMDIVVAQIHELEMAQASTMLENSIRNS